MSQESIAAVEDAYRALASGGLDLFLEHWTDDLDHRSIEGAPDDRGPIHGKDAMRVYMQDWIDTFDDFKTEAVELIDAGGDQVIAMLHASGRAKLSGVETDVTYAVVYTIRDGKVARGREYMSGPKPSKPPGCGSRRCRRRTSKS